MASGTVEKGKIDKVLHTILHFLVFHGTQTEFEILAHVKEVHQISESEGTEKILAWMHSLRSHGYVWAGVMTNNKNKGIWVATPTKEGKVFIRGSQT